MAGWRVMSSPSDDVLVIAVPAQQSPMGPPDKARVRAFKRHLVESLRDLRAARHPERLIQPATPPPEGFAATVVQAGCTQCQGYCCRGGGDHAYIDERTLARVRQARPALDAAGIIALYTRAIAAEANAGSCLFHGVHGCTLAQPLRAELCNTYYCNGLRDFLRLPRQPDKVRIEAARGSIRRTSAVLRRDSG